MGFVNERVSQADVEHHGIDAMWNKYHNKGPKLPGFFYAWTIDRSREIYLMEVYSGREEFSNRITFVLQWKQERFELILAMTGSPTLKGYVETHWDLVAICPPKERTHADNEIIKVLKEALTVFKRCGIARPIEDHTVTFNF